MAALVMVSVITESVPYPDMTPFAAARLSRRQLETEWVELLKRYSGVLGLKG